MHSYTPRLARHGPVALRRKAPDQLEVTPRIPLIRCRLAAKVKRGADVMHPRVHFGQNRRSEWRFPNPTISP